MKTERTSKTNETKCKQSTGTRNETVNEEKICDRSFII